MNASSRPSTAGGGKLVLVALGLAIVSVILTNFYITSVRQEVTLNSFKVYVLKQSVQPGKQLDNKDLREVAIPERFREAFDAMGFMDADSLATRVGTETFQRPASTGEILTFNMFIPPSGKDLDRNITPGNRMISLPVNSRTVPGALFEGMYVDLEASFRTGAALPVPMTIMERVQVKALGTRTIYDVEEGTNRRYGRNYQTITIEVKPDEATALTAIRQLVVGEFELHLRNPADKELPKIPEGGINPKVLRLIETQGRAPQK